MKRKRLTLKLITVLAVTSVLFGVASCHVNSTVQTEIITSSSEITVTSTEPETVPPETTTEPAPITVATTKAETQEQTTTTTTEETTTAPTEKKIKDLSPEWVRNLPQAQDLGTNQLLIVAASGMDKTTCKVSMHERDGEGNWIQIFSVDGYVGKKGSYKRSLLVRRYA